MRGGWKHESSRERVRGEAERRRVGGSEVGGQVEREGSMRTGGE